MSEPSNGAWPFQEIPEEEGLDISAIFGDSSAAPQGDPFAPPAAAQSVPSSPTPVAQEITPAVAATSQPTTAPIAKAPVEAPAENPIAAAFEQKTAENTKKGLLEKPPVFYHKGVKEEIDDPSMTFEELRIRKSDDFTDLEEGKRVSWSVEYCGIRKEVKDPKGTTIISMKEMIERSREFLDALKKTKDKDPCCYVKPKVEMKTKGNAAYKGKFGTLEEARNSDIIKNSVEVDTYAGYVNNIEKRIVPYFRGQRILLRELTALDVENFYSYCFNELHLKGTTVQRFHANIHKAMKYARKHDLIASNPMDNVERPKSQRYVGAFYSVSELETLFQAVKGDPCEFPVLMAAFYGLRRSEIMGLRWRAIDFENNLITIDHTVVQCMCDGTTITVEKDRTKNQSSCRSMPLVPQYRDLLLRMKVRQECCRKLCGNCYTESEYIFVNDMGEPYQPNYVTQHFKLVLRKNHLRSIRFHDLRHTCASLLLKNGVPMKDIQEWLGHSSYNTTANIYAHLDTSSKNTSASKMSNVVIIEPGISTSV